MAFWYLNAAALITSLGAVFHGYIGGKVYLSKIYRSDLETRTRSLSVVAWQMFTIWLAVGAATFICIGLDPSLALMGYPIIAANAIGALFFLYLGVTGHAHLLKLPGAYLMGLTALLGYLGV